METQQDKFVLKVGTNTNVKVMRHEIQYIATDADEQVRIQVYRIWQRLGMVVERGYRKYSDAHLYDWVLPETEKEIQILEEMRKRSHSL